MNTIIPITSGIFAVLFYLSPFTLLIQLFSKKKELNEISALAIMCSLFKAIFSFFLYKEISQNFLEWSNFVGIILTFIWLVIYLIYHTDAKKNICKYSLYLFTVMDLILELCFIGYDILNNDNNNEGKQDDKPSEVRVNIIYVIISLLNILTNVSPGLNFGKFLNEWNQRYICLPMQISSLLSDITFFILEYFSEDPGYFTLITIGISMIISSFFSLFYIFNYNKKIEIKVEADNKNETENKVNLLDENSSKKRKSKKKKLPRTKRHDEILDFI